MSSPRIPSSTPRPPPSALQTAVWQGSLPLSIRIAPSECRIYDQADPYLIHYPRLSYLPILLPRLHAFFTPFLIHPSSTNSAHEGWFSFEDIPLKWHYPLGLLHDLFSGCAPFPSSPHITGPQSLSLPTSSNRNEDQDKHYEQEGEEEEEEEEEEEGQEQKQSAELPWRLVVHFSDWPDEQLVRLDAEGKVMHDAFINSVKEADFLRNGTAKGIMALSKEDSTMLWRAVMEHDLPIYNPINQKLLRAQGAPLRHVPLKIYLPSPPPSSHPATTTPTQSPIHTLRVVQSPIAPTQTLGTALHALLPALFPSRRTPILAKPVLHGAVMPMGAELEELVIQGAAYADGWLHIGVVMMG